MKTVVRTSVLLVLAAVAALTFSCKDKEPGDKTPEATLSLNPSDKTVTFKAEGEDYPFIVTTNQDSWDVALNPADSWLSVEKEGRMFTLTAEPTTSTTAPADVTVTVTAGKASPVVITARQNAFVEGPSLSVSPDPDPVVFDAAATRNFVFEVDTNQSSWKAESDKTWCKIAMSGNKFTVTAVANTATSSPEAATITVTAGDAAPVTITATQDPVEVAILVKAAAAGWTVGDKAGLYATYGTGQQSGIYTVASVGADGSARLTGDLNWKGGSHTFYAYSPAGDAVGADASALKVSVPAVQTQAGATDDHLDAMSFRVAAPATKTTPATTSDEAAATVELEFSEVLSTLEFRLATLAEDFELLSLTVAAPDGETLALTDASVDATVAAGAAGFGALTGGTASATVKLNVTGRPAVPHTDNKDLVSDPSQPAGTDVFAAFVKAAPSDLSGKTLKVTVIGYEDDVDVRYDFDVAGGDYEAGRKHVVATLVMEPDDIPGNIKRNVNIAFGAHTTPGYGAMRLSGFRNEQGDNRDYRFLTEGNLNVDWSYWGTPYTTDPQQQEFAIIKLDNKQPINQLWMRPCNHATRYMQFPLDFEVYVSNTAGYDTKDGAPMPVDDWDWGKPVFSASDCVPANQTEIQKFEFAEVTALYVKILITRQPKADETQYGSAIGEVEIYLNDTPLEP